MLDPKKHPDIANRLMEYGLTFTQAEIYLSLLTRGPSDVLQISSSTEMHRSDVYRKIKILEKMGIVDCIIGSPNRFLAVPPKDVLALLQRRMKDSVDRLTVESKEFAEELDTLKADETIPDKLSKFTTSFSLISGRRRYWQETKSMIAHANREVLRIVDKDGLKSMFTTDLFSELKSAAKRGVKVKLISEVTPENYGETALCRESFEIRHLSGATLRFIDVDSEGVILCGSLDRTKESLDEGKFLKFHDRKFGEIMKFFFDELWNVAEPVEALEQSGKIAV